MKQFFVILSFMCTLSLSAQESITPLTFSCDNGQTTGYLFVADSSIQVKLFIELQEPRMLRCVFNGELHHNEYVETSGVRIVKFNGVGQGSPDHVATFSLRDGNDVETTPGVAIDHIPTPWLFIPPLSMGPAVVITDTVLQWSISRGPFFHLPNNQNGIGGCPEHRLFLIEKRFIGGDIVFVDTFEVTESMDTVTYEFETTYGGQLGEACSETSLVRIDTSVDEPADFSPEEVSTGTLVEDCTLVGTLSTSTSEQDVDIFAVYPNPFTNSFTISGTGMYEIHEATGALVENGTILGSTSISGATWQKGLYILTITTPRGQMVEKLVCE